MNEVNFTLNHERFILSEHNRQVNERHVKRLEREIVSMGKVAYPILVTEDDRVIDGQHRLEACRNLGIPVPYIRTSGMHMGEVVRLNNAALKWTTEDRVRSFASMGNEHYQRLLDFGEACKARNPRISMCTAAKLAQGNMSTSGFKKRGKSLPQGTWTFDSTDEQAYARLNTVCQFNRWRFHTKEAFISALFSCMKHPQFKISRLIKQATNYPHLMEDAGTRQGFLRMLERVYNHYRNEKNHLRLF